MTTVNAGRPTSSSDIVRPNSVTVELRQFGRSRRRRRFRCGRAGEARLRVARGGSVRGRRPRGRRDGGRLAARPRRQCAADQLVGVRLGRKADDELAADEIAGTRTLPLPCAFESLRQARERRGVPAHVADDDHESRLLAAERDEKGLGPGAVRATLADEGLDVGRRQRHGAIANVTSTDHSRISNDARRNDDRTLCMGLAPAGYATRVRPGLATGFKFRVYPPHGARAPWFPCARSTRVASADAVIPRRRACLRPRVPRGAEGQARPRDALVASPVHSQPGGAP